MPLGNNFGIKETDEKEEKDDTDSFHGSKFKNNENNEDDFEELGGGYMDGDDYDI